eukprot:522453-Heterocapsa_arctica.AAC.1
MMPEVKRKSKFLYSVFIQVLGGRALTLLRLVPKSNGFEPWRMLVQVCSHAASSHEARLHGEWVSRRVDGVGTPSPGVR